MSEVILNSTLAVPSMAPSAPSVAAAEATPGNKGEFSQILNQLTEASQTQDASTAPTPAQSQIQNENSGMSSKLTAELIKPVETLASAPVLVNGASLTLDSLESSVTKEEETELSLIKPTESATSSEKEVPVATIPVAVQPVLNNSGDLTMLPLVQSVLNPEPVQLETVLPMPGDSLETTGLIGEGTVQPGTLAERLVVSDTQDTESLVSVKSPITSPSSAVQSQSQLNLAAADPQMVGQISEPEILRVIQQSAVPEKALKLTGLQSGSAVEAGEAAINVAVTAEENTAATVIPLEQRKFSPAGSITLRSFIRENARVSSENQNQNLVNGKGLIIQPLIQTVTDESQLSGITGFSGEGEETAHNSDGFGVDLSIPKTGAWLANNHSEANSATQMVSTSFTDVLEGVTENVTDGLDAAPVKKEAVFSQIVEKAKVIVANDNSQMELQLKPDSLGKIQLRITMENHLISARFVAESEQVKSLIESNFTDLKQMLNQSGIQIDQLSVSVGQQGSGSHHPAGNPFQGSHQPSFTVKQHQGETAEGENEYPGSTQPNRNEMRIDLIA